MKKDFILVSLLSYVLLGLITFKAVSVIHRPNYVCVLSPYPLNRLVLVGIVIGLFYTLIGIIAYKKSIKWRNSMLSLVGASLVKGNMFILIQVLP